VTQVYRMPRAAWLYHFKAARKASNKSRRVARERRAAVQAATAAALTAPSSLRKTPKPPVR
jgi:hypothetical protein